MNDHLEIFDSYMMLIIVSCATNGYLIRNIGAQDMAKSHQSNNGTIQ